MPKLRRMRIVNLQYNKGNVLIPDEIWDFGEDSKSTLIHMENAGGKTTSIHVGIQPIIPRAKIGEREIECYFIKPTDHSFVVLEWNLDNSDRKLMTGIAMAAGDTVNQDGDKTPRIKYYTFLSTYTVDEDREDTLIGLPLSRKDENGNFVAAAYDDVRALSKRLNTLEKYSSEDRVRWREKLAEYGISQEEFQVCAEINYVESGVSGIFETSDVKSSDGLINKLFLPRIDKKCKSHVDIKEDTSLESMLEAYAIEDMSLESQISERTNLAAYANELVSINKSVDALWGKNEEFIKAKAGLFGFMKALRSERERLESRIEELKSEIVAIEEEQRRIRHEKASAAFYTADKQHKAISEQVSIANENLDKADKNLHCAEHRRDIIECARDAKEIRALENKIQALMKTISDLENNSDMAKTLKSLKYSVKVAVAKELDTAKPQQAELESKQKELEADLSDLVKKMDDLSKRIHDIEKDIVADESALGALATFNDSRVAALGLGISRHLDGHYAEGELLSWEKKTDKDLQATTKEIDGLREKEEDLTRRSYEIPKRINDAEKHVEELKSQLTEIEKKINEYSQKENEIQSICNHHGIDFGTRFTDGPRQYMESQIAQMTAKIKGTEQKKNSTIRALAAISQGTLHIPSAVLEFLDSNNIRYVSVEHYLTEQMRLGILTSDQVVAFLDKYPHAAYGIKIDKEAYDSILREAAKQDWLPAVLPLFMDTDIDEMLAGIAKTNIKLLSVFSRKYFGNMSSYTQNLESQREDLDRSINLLQAKCSSVTKECECLEDFTSQYTSDWIKTKQGEAAKLEKDIQEAASVVSQIEAEGESIKNELSNVRVQSDELKEHKRDVEGKLREYKTLVGELSKEHEFEDRIKASHVTLIERKNELEAAKSNREDTEREAADVTERLRTVRQQVDKMQKILNDVNGAEVAEITAGDYEELYEEYKVRSASQNDDIQEKRERVREHSEDKARWERSLERRKNVAPEEYADVEFSDEALDQAEEELTKASENKDKAQKEASQLAFAFGQAEACLNSANKDLVPYGGTALPVEEIGTDFDRRAKEAGSRISECRANRQDIEDVRDNISLIILNGEDVVRTYDRPDKNLDVVLEKDYKSQFEGFKRAADSLRKEVDRDEAAVNDLLIQLQEKFTGLLRDGVIESIKEMQKKLTDRSITGDRYYTLSAIIGNDIKLSENRVKQINTDLSNHDQMKINLVNQCVIQGNRLYKGLINIAANTKSTVWGVRRQVVMLDLPKTVDETVATAAITAEIDGGINELKRVIQEDPCNKYNIEKAAHKIVGNENIVRKYIGSEKILVRTFKVDLRAETSCYCTWESSHKAYSGAQKTLVYFAIIMALMAYSRNSIGDISDNRGIVLPLDNPFATMTSAHVVNPWYEIAQKYNVQLLCFTDIKNVDVIRKFENVIKLKCVPRKASYKMILTHDGNATIEHGYYRSDPQTKMF